MFYVMSQTILQSYTCLLFSQCSSPPRILVSVAFKEMVSFVVLMDTAISLKLCATLS